MLNSIADIHLGYLGHAYHMSESDKVTKCNLTLGSGCLILAWGVEKIWLVTQKK